MSTFGPCEYVVSCPSLFNPGDDVQWTRLHGPCLSHDGCTPVPLLILVSLTSRPIAFYFLDWLAVIAKRKVTCPYNLTPAIGLKFCLSFLIEDKWRWYWAGMWGRWYRSLDLNVSSWLVSPTLWWEISLWSEKSQISLRVVSFDKYSWMSLTRLDTLVTYQDRLNAIQSWPAIKKGHFPERQ